MLVEKKYFKIEYNSSITYIPEVIDYLEIKMQDIMNFFEIKTIKKPRKIIIYDNLEEYKKHIEKFTTYRDYMCADTNDGNINLLSLEAAHKTKTHANMTLNELKTTICHEFVHICHQESEVEHIEPEIIWFWEALATNLGNPNMFHKIEITAADQELDNFSSLKNNYLIAFTIEKYLLENYSHVKIIEYIRFPQKLKDDSKKIISEAKKYSKK